jgi:hypothetical protein
VIVCIVGIIDLMTCVGKKYIDAARVKLTTQDHLGFYFRRACAFPTAIAGMTRQQRFCRQKTVIFEHRNVIAAWPELNADYMSPLLARSFTASIAVDRQPARRIIQA